MSDERPTTYARVTVTLEFAVGDTWGPDCTMGQVHKQAKEKALAMVQKLGFPLRPSEVQHPLLPAMRILGEPKVHAISSVERV